MSSDEEEIKFIKKNVKPKQQTKDTKETKNIVPKPKKNQNKIQLFELKNELDDKYLCQLLNLKQSSLDRIFKKCDLTHKNDIFCNSSKLSDLELSFYIITRRTINYECKLCQIKPIWNDMPLLLILDRINNKQNDSNLKNLRFLCPNCFSQHKGKNKIFKTKSESIKVKCKLCNNDFPKTKMIGNVCKECNDFNNFKKSTDNDKKFNKWMTKQNTKIDLNIEDIQNLNYEIFEEGKKLNDSQINQLIMLKDIQSKNNKRKPIDVNRFKNIQTKLKDNPDYKSKISKTQINNIYKHENNDSDNNDITTTELSFNQQIIKELEECNNKNNIEIEIIKNESNTNLEEFTFN